MDFLLKMKKTFTKIETYFTEDSLSSFLKCSYDHLYNYHYSFGKWIRNYILSEKELFHMFQSVGITQIDDMSNFLILLFYMEQHTKFFYNPQQK